MMHTLNSQQKTFKKARTVTMVCVPRGCNDIRFPEVNRISKILPALDRKNFVAWERCMWNYSLHSKAIFYLRIHH